MGKKLIPKDNECQKCEHYNPRKWYCRGKEVEVFCDYIMTDIEKKFLK